MTTLRPAAFLDRDGTLIHDAHYLRDAALVELLPGVPAGLHRLKEAGYALIVVTNQSGIAQGLVTEDNYRAVKARLDALLAAEGLTLDGSYYCPHHPSVSGPCRCRKPGSGMHEQASLEHRLDPARSFGIGDRWRDLEPVMKLGGRGILIPSPDTPAENIERAKREAQFAKDFTQAVEFVLAATAS